MKVSIVRFLINKIKSGLGIVQDTDTATQAISKGKYVFWKGSLKKASSNIAATNTLSSSNLSDVSEGVLNELSEQIGTINSKIGNLSSLNTTAKTNLVAAINEVKSDAKTNSLPILTAKVATSTFESNIVRVGNVVAGSISIVTTGNTGDSVTMISGFPAPRLNPQIPVWSVSGTQAGKRVLIDANGNMKPWWCSGIPAGNYIISFCYIAI